MQQTKIPLHIFFRAVLVLAVPIALQNLLTSCGSLIDAMMIVPLGNAATAAVGVAGRFTFLLEKEKPHTINGIDISPAMLKIAEKHKAALGSQAQFFQGDICRMATDHQYDLVFSSTVFHYIQELAPLFARIAALLKPHGQCIISQLHPVYTAQYPIAREGHFPDDEEWNVRYLDKNLRGYIQPWIEYNDDVSNFLSYSYHHTLSDYFQAITSSGLTITDMAEPMPPRDWQEKYPGRYEAFIETPSYLILKLQKA